MQPSEKDVLDLLRELPDRQPSPATRERVHRIARAAFARRAASARGDRWLAWLGRIYWRVELVLAAGVTVVYLGWAARTALGIVGIR